MSTGSSDAEGAIRFDGMRKHRLASAQFLQGASLMADQPIDVIALAADLTAAWIANPNSKASAEDVPVFLQTMHDTITALSGPVESAAREYTPAVSVRASVKPDHLVSLIDGRKYKSLKRHLKSHGLTPNAYRERYGLKTGYPMVAPAYSEARRAIAARLGLGRKAKTQPTEVAGADVTVPVKPTSGKEKAMSQKGARRPRLSVKFQGKVGSSDTRHANAPKSDG
jgi:predicted transcriptional regulator